MPRGLFSTRTYHTLRIPLLLMLGLALLSVAAYGQEAASIVGTVTDQTGAAVPSAKITITSVETGFVRTTTTNNTGSYSAPQLPVGHYKVRAEAPGFKAYEQTGITLNVDATVRVDVPLQVGNVTESITVEANAVQVQADTNEVSQTVTSTQVADLATNGRNVIQLTTLVPGASASIPDFDSPMAQNQNRSVYFNGQRQDHNNWMIDGGEAYDRGGGGILIVSPSQDALQEFKVITSNYAADLGQSSGGMITMSLKSGTQHYHGGAWEFLRNKELDANNFFNNAAGPGHPRPKLNYNMFGFNFGGPVPITRATCRTPYRNKMSEVVLMRGWAAVRYCRQTDVDTEPTPYAAYSPPSPSAIRARSATRIVPVPGSRRWPVNPAPAIAGRSGFTGPVAKCAGRPPRTHRPPGP